MVTLVDYFSKWPEASHQLSESSFHHGGSLVKLVQACLSARKDLEGSFHSCGGPLKLVEAFFSAGKD